MYDSMNTKNEWETIHSEKSDVAIYLRVSTDEQNVDSQFLMVDGLLSLDPEISNSRVRLWEKAAITRSTTFSRPSWILRKSELLISGIG